MGISNVSTQSDDYKVIEIERRSAICRACSYFVNAVPSRCLKIIDIDRGTPSADELARVTIDKRKTGCPEGKWI